MGEGEPPQSREIEGVEGKQESPEWRDPQDNQQNRGGRRVSGVREGGERESSHLCQGIKNITC